MNCRALTFRFYALLNKTVIDGTLCRPNDPTRVCVAGTCKVRKSFRIIYFLSSFFLFQHVRIVPVCVYLLLALNMRSLSCHHTGPSASHSDRPRCCVGGIVVSNCFLFLRYRGEGSLCVNTNDDDDIIIRFFFLNFSFSSAMLRSFSMIQILTQTRPKVYN